MKPPALFRDDDERDKLRRQYDHLGAVVRELTGIRQNSAVAIYRKSNPNLPGLPLTADILRACEVLENAQACLANLYAQQR